MGGALVSAFDSDQEAAIQAVVRRIVDAKMQPFRAKEAVLQKHIEALEHQLNGGRRLADDTNDFELAANFMNDSELAANLTALADKLAVVHAELDTSVDTTWILVAGLICFFLQAGFGMLEAGAVRAKNTKNIMIKNLMDAVVGGL
eukprot:CAMPEP_0179197776 /NCGR_PEP_ID=MMETSP0796-20121207/98358_1 /TAXON_ID=73915 /ORGANISM="Pyrodinium bahamense, Strain pbaha01" /LENGTH=145 /DNA_ID=CAMNT_0020902205 /DNA_START=63 /DNA_END=496 /DNA_ORIENTATION=+